MGIAHVALDLGLGDQRSHGVDDDYRDGAGPNQHLADLQCIFAGIRLGDQQVVDVYADALRIDGVERVLGIDKGSLAALLLSFCDDVQRQRRLTGRFRSVDLDDPSLGYAAYAAGDVEADGSRGDRFDI